jgi:hypothetical protein
MGGRMLAIAAILLGLLPCTAAAQTANDKQGKLPVSQQVISELAPTGLARRHQHVELLLVSSKDATSPGVAACRRSPSAGRRPSRQPLRGEADARPERGRAPSACRRGARGRQPPARYCESRRYRAGGAPLVAGTSRGISWGRRLGSGQRNASKKAMCAGQPGRFHRRSFVATPCSGHPPKCKAAGRPLIDSKSAVRPALPKNAAGGFRANFAAAGAVARRSERHGAS